MDSWRPGCSGGSWEINEQASLSYSLNWGLSRKVYSCLCHPRSIASFAHIEGFGLTATITAEFKALAHTIQDSNVVVLVLGQHHLFGICHLRESSARFTKQWQPRALVLIGSLPAEHFSPCPFALSPLTRRLQPLDGREGLKGSLGFYFCSLCRLPHIMVPPQQDWPRGSNTLTAHKQQQGLQMTTCHRPRRSHLQLTKHFQ